MSVRCCGKLPACDAHLSFLQPNLRYRFRAGVSKPWFASLLRICNVDGKLGVTQERTPSRAVTDSEHIIEALAEGKNKRVRKLLARLHPAKIAALIERLDAEAVQEPKSKKEQGHLQAIR